MNGDDYCYTYLSRLKDRELIMLTPNGFKKIPL